MAEPINIQDLIDGRLDIQSLGEAANGDENTTVVTRTGETYPSAKKAINAGITKLFEAGGLPAKPFPTLAQMQVDGASLIDGQLAMVHDDIVNNGLYVKRAGSWIKAAYDPLTQSKTYTDTAKTSAISTAATDATNKANAAKLYADNIPKLANKVISSNATAKKLQGVSTGTDYSVTPSIKYISYGNLSKHSHLIKVKPNTIYTLLVNKIINKLHVSSFDSDQDTWFKSQAPQKYELITAPTMAEARRYYTFTTGAHTNYIVTEFENDSTDPNFIVCEGVYNVSMWDSFNALAFDKSLNLSELSADTIKSKMFSESKNLAQHFIYGQQVNPTLALNTPSSVAYRSVSAWNAVNKDIIVSVLVSVKPNTTYTISKEPSDCFRIALKDSVANSGIVVLRDASLSSYTLTTGATDDTLCVQVSENYERPRVQIELGDKVTVYESSGIKFADAAFPLGAKLTDRVKATDNTYINLGVQTDRYKNMGTAVATPETGYTTQTILDDFYEPLLADYPSIVSKNLLGKDSSGLNDIYEYVFEPDHVEQTIFITAGMHPTEKVTSFALGILLNEIYRNPSKHEGLAYLRNRVKICVIPVLNTWATNQNPKLVPQHYTNFNKVNINRNFPERWETIIEDGPYNKKGASAASEVETQYVMQVLHREKDNLAFYIDCHTGQGWTQDSLMYWLEEDNFLRPQLEQVVSMRNDIVRSKYGREPINETYETQRATSSFYSWRVCGVPASTVEYGAVPVDDLSSSQTTDYTDLLFNCVHYALRAKIKEQIMQAERNEHNKPFLSLYNTLSGYNNVVNQVWSYADWQTKLYDKLGLTKSSMGAASGAYDLVKYTHTPSEYKNTVLLSAGAAGSRKSVTTLGFIAHKLMTDNNPHIVELRSNTRFIFIPCLNPDGYDNKKTTNANNVDPFVNFATSTQPESVALRALVDAGGFDLYVDLSGNTNLTTPAKPSGYADLQVIYNNKADADHRTIFSLLDSKYKKPVTVAASKFSSSITKSNIATYINAKNVAYESVFLEQNVLPVRVTIEGKYVDYGYEADELAYCSEVVLNSVKSIDKKLSLIKYLAAI